MLCFLFGWLGTQAQPTALRQGGSKAVLERTDLHLMPRQNNEQLLAEELKKRRPGRAPRFATTLRVSIRPQNDGTWEHLGEDHVVWRQRIRSAGAHSLNLGFSEFHLPDGALLYLYSPDGAEQFGPLTAADNDAHATYWTPAIRAQELVVEVQVPQKQKEEVILRISHVNHDFLGISKVVSGGCNLDVTCTARQGWPLVDRYRHLVQSVGLLTIDGSTYCSGFLINNARNDCRPFFMTAEHCDIDSENAASVVVYWNYQNSYCREPGSINSAGLGNGEFNQINSGATWRAEYRPSDFTLLELDDPVLPEANGYFAGWANTREAFTDTAFTIHHPANEEKRISFDFDEVYLGRWEEGTQAFDDGNHVIVRNWEVGTTEEGSSGGPLFNKYGQVIGQLHGGRAACGNSEFDAFGWLGLSWEGEGHPTNSLKSWLDPDRSGVTELDGRWNKSCQKFIEAAAKNQPLCLGDTARFMLSVSEAFEEDVNIEKVALPPGIELLNDPERTYLPGREAELQVVLNGQPQAGVYPFVIRAYDDRDTINLELEVSVHYLPEAFELLTPARGEELDTKTVRLSWSASRFANRYRIVLANDSTFTEIIAERVAADTQYVFDQLTFNTDYYWKVIAESACGMLSQTDGFFRTGPNLRLSIVERPSRICSTEVVHYQLRLGQDYGPAVSLSYDTNVPEAVEVVFADNEKDVFAGGEQVSVAIRILTPQAGREITITLRARENERSSSIQLSLRPEGQPGPAPLLDPLNEAVRLPGAIALRWGSQPFADNYTVEIARDPEFADLVLARTLPDTTFQPESSLTGGLYYWRISAENGCGRSTSEVRSFRIQDNALGKLNETSIAIEPNPAYSIVNVHVSRPLENATVSLYSLTGERLVSYDVTEKGRLLQINVSHLPAGMYVVRLQQRQSSLSRRVMVVR